MFDFLGLVSCFNELSAFCSLSTSLERHVIEKMAMDLPLWAQLGHEENVIKKMTLFFNYSLLFPISLIASHLATDS